MPLYGLCVGVPDESPSHRPRFAPQAMLLENQYPTDDETLTHIDHYDETYAQYLQARGAKPGTWSKAMLNKFSDISRPGLAAFYLAQGARLD